jgi:hypothetical protein
LTTVLAHKPSAIVRYESDIAGSNDYVDEKVEILMRLS